MTSEYVDESEDRVDSMTELLSDSRTTMQSEIPKPVPVGIGASLRYSFHGSAATNPEEESILSKNLARRSTGSIASFSRSTRSGSTGRRPKSATLKSPSTPGSWINLKSPLARIESFHSDDFECLADNEIDNHSCAAESPMSATTPTVPCFAYKLHMLKKKQHKIKNNNANGNGTLNNAEHSFSKLNQNSSDKKHVSSNSNKTATIMEPLLSSGEETDHHEDIHGGPGKSKIHPMSIG